MVASHGGSITFLKIPTECYEQELIQDRGETAATRPAIATQVEERFLSLQADASQKRSAGRSVGLLHSK
jgi:hypothetical protein